MLMFPEASSTAAVYGILRDLVIDIMGRCS